MDTHKNKLLNKNTLLFFFIIFAAFFLRIYNLNFEDYWFDEQASFWVSDPTINLSDTIERSKQLDRGSNIVFNLFLKNFFFVIWIRSSNWQIFAIYFRFPIYSFFMLFSISNSQKSKLFTSRIS